MTTSASLYARGGTIYNQIEASQGTAAADKAWQDAINAERNGAPLDGSFWSNLGGQLYNNPLGAPIEQASRVGVNSVKSVGDAAKAVLSAGFGNWGAILVGIALLFGLFLYFGGGKFIRGRVTNLK